MNVNQSKLVSVMNRRLKEATKFWYQACSDYQDLDEFLSSLNALIQALRNITFILQSNKKLIPDFDEWYSKQQEMMRANKLLKWLVKSRNTVVKQGDLKPKSLAKVSLVNWKNIPLMEFEVDPLLKREEIPMPKEIADIFVEIMREPAMRIERRWVVDTLPEYEVLEALSMCYVELKGVIKSSYVQCGLTTQEAESSLSVEPDGFILNNTVSDDIKVVNIDLKNGAVLELSTLSVFPTKEDSEYAMKRYKPNETFLKIKKSVRDDPFLLNEKLFDMAKIILKKDGYHISVVHFYYKNKPPSLSVLQFRDKTEQYVQIRRIANRIKGDEITGIIFISEMWESSFDSVKKHGVKYPVDDPDRKEALTVATVNNEGRYEMIFQFFHKDEKGRVIFDNCEKESDLSRAYWLSPILEAWGIKVG